MLYNINRLHRIRRTYNTFEEKNNRIKIISNIILFHLNFNVYFEFLYYLSYILIMLLYSYTYTRNNNNKNLVESLYIFFFSDRDADDVYGYTFGRVIL